MRTKRKASAEGVEASQDPKKLSSSLGFRRKSVILGRLVQVL